MNSQLILKKTDNPVGASSPRNDMDRYLHLVQSGDDVIGVKMDRIQKVIQNFHSDESGATATEYIILLVLIACFVISAVKFYGQTVSEKYGWADERVAKFVTF